MGFMGWITGREPEATAQRAPRHAPDSARPVLPRSEAAPVGVIPPSRERASAAVSARDAVGLTSVYRAFDILTTAALQISFDSIRNGEALPSLDTPAILRRPDITTDRESFIEQTVLALASEGNAYWRKLRGSNSEVIALQPLNPHEVLPQQDARTKRISYHHKGEAIPASDIEHLYRMKLPGQLRGIGPIQAARLSIRGALETQQYANTVFDGSGQPSGILTSEQQLTSAETTTARNRWNGLDDDGEPLPTTSNPSGVKVLGKGLNYKPILISPKDAQWVEAQQFSVTEVARLFGIPASLLLAAVEGSSTTYSNVEQDWLAFSRFTLMGYLRKIELAFTRLIPNGQTARANLEALLRPDTTTRYAAHGQALSDKWMTVDEVRAIEKLPELTDAQRDQIAAMAPAKATPAPAAKGNPA